jgi:hypothetical protein
MARPLSDKDLEFAENMTARALFIQNRCKNLILLLNDSDAIGLVLEIYHKANEIRTSTIAWKDNHKETVQ